MKSSLLAKLLGAGVLAFGLGAAQAATCTAVSPDTNPDATLTNSDLCGQGLDLPPSNPNASAAEIKAAYAGAGGALLDWTEIGPVTGADANLTSGSWAFNAIAPYTDYIIVLKDGAVSNDGVDWFWFHIDLSGGCTIGAYAGTFDYCGTWTMYGTNGSPKQLSHSELWAANSSGGESSTGTIPEPSSTGLLALMGLGLIVASFRARRKS